MGNHLKRQAGVAEANYRAGTIELTADETRRAFEIGTLLRTLKEIGITPIKRIDASVPGRVVQTVNGHELHVVGTGERLVLQSVGRVNEGEQVLKGIIEARTDGTITFKPEPAR